MAGGRFDVKSSKTRPGAYINFESTRQNLAGTSQKGIVLIPLINHKYGPSGEFITLTQNSLDKETHKLGYSIYDDELLLIREAFKLAHTVIVYITKTGTNASITIDGITATAMYGGSRGNDLSYNVISNPISGFDVNIYLKQNLVESYSKITTISHLANSKYIKFTGESEVIANAGSNLKEGTDEVSTNSDITLFLDNLESIKFNTLAFPVTDTTLHEACKTKIKYLRESVGKGVKAVVPDFNADYEGIINVTNSVALGEKLLTNAQACAYVAAADASALSTQSNTYAPYVGATDIVNAKTNEVAILAIQNGELFFSKSPHGDIVIEYDINSLTTFTNLKDKTYSKNRVLRVFDTFAESLQLSFPPNKFDNSPTGFDIVEGIGKTILKEFYEMGAIKNVNYDSDFIVDREKSTDDEIYFYAGLEPVDSAEKLYFTIKTR